VIIKRYSNIDQLRFIAALTVAMSHLMISANGSNLNLEILSSISVEVFFIISGFVLAPQILKVAKSKNIDNYKIFLIRRWYRTIPLYILSLTLTSIILGQIFSFDFLKYLFFIQNFFKIIVELDYFSISWSLSVEEWFYLIFPFFLFIFFKFYNFDDRKLIMSASILFIFLILLIRFININEEEWGSNVRRVVLFRLDSIVFGFIVYFYKDKIKDNLFNKIWLLTSIIVTSIIVFKILEINASKNIIFYKMIFHYIVALWGLLVVLFFYLIDKKIKKNYLIKLNLFLGRISYSIYLFHLLIIYIISLLNISVILTIFLFLFVQIFVSSLLYYFFEKPILELRPSY
jgi:peptidoglycan/LPS O-acetylase OafA/YrhL